MNGGGWRGLGVVGVIEGGWGEWGWLGVVGVNGSG